MYKRIGLTLFLFLLVVAGNAQNKYLPDGRNKWDDKKYQSKLEHMSTVLSLLATDKVSDGAAVIGMAEVENRRVLEDLLKQPALAGRGYQIIHYEGPDERGIDCAMFYNPELYQVKSTRLVPYQLAEPSDRPTRGFLIADGELAGERVAFIVNRAGACLERLFATSGLENQDCHYGGYERRPDGQEHGRIARSQT